MCKTEDRCDADGTDVASNSDRAAGSRAGSGGSPSMLTPLVHVAEGEEDGLRRTSELWQIHGKHFDLTGFLRQHPGGASILEAVRGAEDITPLFESYHALANTSAIRKSLEKFEWKGQVIDDVARREAALVGGAGKEPVRYRWDEGGFYEVLKVRVKQHFLHKHGQGGVDPRTATVNRFVKAPLTWYLKEILIVGVYVPLLVYMLGFDIFGLGVFLSGAWARRAVVAFSAGAVLQSFSFCTLHDASHYGLWFKRPRAQEVISRVCNAWTLWHHGLWLMHHVYGHHSFTGDPERDPDLVHARPYLRKSILTPKGQYDPFLLRWQRLHAPLFMMVMPGATVGQTLAYRRALREGHLWHVSIPAHAGGTRWYEYLTYVLAVGVHFVGGNFFVSFCYFMGISVAYHLCIAPDHDTFESGVVNSIENKHRQRNGMREGDVISSIRGDGDAGLGSDGVTVGNRVFSTDSGSGGEAGRAASGREEEQGDDWGEVQVRHSGNFSNGNPLVTQITGGINYQIEHHLFPSVSHMLYEEIAPIVRAACQEFSIPYNAHPSLYSAYKSYLKHLMLCSGVYPPDMAWPRLGGVDGTFMGRSAPSPSMADLTASSSRAITPTEDGEE